MVLTGPCLEYLSQYLAIQKQNYLSTPLIYICSTVYKMAKILTQKYLLQSFFHIRLDTVRSKNDRFQYTVKR